MKKATTRPLLMTTKTPSVAADRYRNLARRDLEVGTTVLADVADVDSEVASLCWLNRGVGSFADAASWGRLKKVDVLPLLKGARV